MSDDLFPLIDAFAALDVLVLGDAMLDTFLDGTTERLCPEAPAPVVALAGRRDLPGGSANVAVNVRSLGARVQYLSAVGDDAEGTLLCQVLEQRGVGTGQVLADPTRRTLSKQRVVAAGQILLRLDAGTTTPLATEMERTLAQRLEALYPTCDAVVVSDYGYGIVTPRIVRLLADLQARYPRVLVADSRRLEAFRDVGLTAAKPNYQEALALLGAGSLSGVRGRAEAMAAHGDRLLDATGARIVAATLDQEGALVFQRGRPPYRTHANAVRGACVAGAGDTFTCALALALAAGAAAPAAAELAAAAAAVVVGKEQTADCSAQELREFLSTGGKYFADWQRLAARLDAHRRQGRRVVFTNGCFDILHRGHVSYLHAARKLGDVLVVGVNSDDGIRRLKGPSRPINSLEDRLQVLGALGCIDHLVSFDDDTPENLLRVVRPDVFVKGGDYTRDRLPEAALVEAQGGVVHILPYLGSRSTTSLLEQIREGPAPALGRRLPAAAGREP